MHKYAIKMLQNTTYENTREYCDLSGLITVGKVVKVYDGDTFWLAIPLNSLRNNSLYQGCEPVTSEFVRIKIRLARIDCPEIRPKKDCINAETEKYKANEAKKFVEQLILNQIVSIKIISKDLYGRYITEVTINDSNLSDLILGAGHAVEYKR